MFKNPFSFMITTDQVKELREKTGISVMQCKKALEDAGGDMEKALILLRKKGSEIASKKSERTLASGVVASYIHSDKKTGVLLELLCETDFVAKNDEFKALADDIAMHIAAMSPQFAREQDVTDTDRAKAAEVFSEETEKLNKPEEIKKKILQGKLDAYFSEKVLLTQPFVREPEISVGALIERAIQKTGERIEVGRFARYNLS